MDLRLIYHMLCMPWGALVSSLLGPWLLRARRNNPTACCDGSCHSKKATLPTVQRKQGFLSWQVTRFENSLLLSLICLPVNICLVKYRSHDASTSACYGLVASGNIVCSGHLLLRAFTFFFRRYKHRLQHTSKSSPLIAGCCCFVSPDSACNYQSFASA